ncbi:alpha-amylase family protein [Flaviaesturariibacter amylovorans]|uniref:Alpha-amylase family protein n=1 Tax=Flaviaesturariibacter amylovorans TaxID=1084520 RepID=A0ABP8H055_9BACT
MEEAWYRNAIFYSLDVETFHDGNGDGIGDFAGLTEKLEYLHGLGIDCLWLLPFYPSPNRDNGYDVMDYYNVDSRLGSLGDFAQFLNKAERLGIRVLIDLVLNHTSVKHPWFQAARRSPEDPHHDYYVWSPKPLPHDKSELMFQGEEERVWTWDKKARKYYLHRFYREQPDLNIAHGPVRAEILKIMAFWLRLGVHGFRIDATQALIETYGLKGFTRKQGLQFIGELQAFARGRRADVLLLAEVNAGVGEMNTFLEGGRLHMLFNFYLNQHLFLALATGRRTALERALDRLPALPPNQQWLQFLRHHDELNLRLLKPEERDRVFSVFAPEEDMRIYGFGIRRRLVPLFGGPGRWVQLAYSLLFSMPGAPLLRYGDEIGMGEQLRLPGRASVRTPMQWSDAPKGGFSDGAGRTVAPVVARGPYGFVQVNVARSQQDPGSLLNWLERLISTRKQCPEIGNGRYFKRVAADRALLLHGFEGAKRRLLFLHNLSPEPVLATWKELGFRAGEATGLFADGAADDDPDGIRVAGHGFRWLSIHH